MEAAINRSNGESKTSRIVTMAALGGIAAAILLGTEECVPVPQGAYEETDTEQVVSDSVSENFEDQVIEVDSLAYMAKMSE